MSKFKVGEIVNVEYSNGEFIKSKVLRVSDKLYDLEALETLNTLLYFKGKLFSCYEGYLSSIELPEVKQVLQVKPNNDFIYFKNKGFIIPKKVLKETSITINEVVILNKEPETGFKKGFGVYSSNCQLKDFETREEANEFLKTLSELLGSDVI